MRKSLKTYHKELLDHLIDDNINSLEFCVICKKKNCNKGCGYFFNSQFLLLVLQKMVLILKNEKTPECINVKKISKDLRLFAKEYHEKEFAVIEQTKLFYEVQQKIIERIPRYKQYFQNK